MEKVLMRDTAGGEEKADPAADRDMDLRLYAQEQLALARVDIRTYSPPALAYIGDGIYEVLIRFLVMSGGNRPVHQMHRQTSRLVRAQQQSAMMEIIRPLLSEEEAAVYRRGKNAKPHTPAKHASLSDYRRATGFEAVVGWLYLKGEVPRLIDLVKAGLEGTGNLKPG